MSGTPMPNDPYTNEPNDLYISDVAESSTDASSNPKRRFSPFAIVVIVATVLLIAVVAYGIYQNQLDTRSSGEAPDFALKTYDGDTINLSDFEGNTVVVINFWQSNCAPCHDEAPMLVRVYNEYKSKGVEFIGVNAKDPDKLALEYIDQYDIAYINGLDIGDKIQKSFRTTGYPETFIIDREGNILRHFPGPPSEAVLRAEIERALETS